MQLFTTILLASALVFAVPAKHPGHASEIAHAKPVGVVELFTSQGCSSCPKADAALNTIADHPDFIAISYHVDYWNYLGWKDTLSAKENTDRQYAYSKAFGNANVFTPQIVLNGIRTTKAPNASSIFAELAQMKSANSAPEVPLSAEVHGDEITISVGNGSGKANVDIAYFRKRTEVDIHRGENSGKKVVYRNAVSTIETVGMWEGKPLTLKLPTTIMEKHGYDGCAILLQSQDNDGNPGRIYGAVALDYSE